MFPCDHCDRNFNVMLDLKLHVKNCHQSPLQVCRFCGKEAKNLQIHERRHEKKMKESKYEDKCFLCTRKFLHRCSLDNHRIRHASIYTCSDCGGKCDGPKELRYNAIDPLAPTFLIVKLEDNYFRIPTSLSMFMMKEPGPPGEGSNASTAKDDTTTTSPSKPTATTTTTSTESSEMGKDSGDQLEDLDDTPLDFRKKQEEEKKRKKTSSPLLPFEEPPKKKHTCEICYASFDRKSKHTRHMYKHSNSRPHKCAICSKGFKTSAHLARHMEIHDEPVTWHTCSLCDFKARTKPYLKIHYIRKHTEDYNYKCEQCGKMFKVQSDYTTHVKDHDTESCVCDICGSSYPSKSSLYFHKYYKHKTKVKKFQCQTCKKKFKTQKNLDSHMELHKIKYVCEQCGMEFKTKYGLTKHLRTHSGEKSYLCAICGKTFGCLSSQKIHLLTHVGERPYVCDICGQSFTQRSPMMLHRRKHPGVHPAPPPIKITNLLHGVQDKIIVNKSSK